jgi:hypothetical protein
MFFGSVSFACSIQGPVRWPVIRAHMFMEDLCWLCPGLIIRELFSAHIHQLWKFMMPSFVKLHSYVPRSLVRIVGSLAH